MIKAMKLPQVIKCHLLRWHSATICDFTTEQLMVIVPCNKCCLRFSMRFSWKCIVGGSMGYGRYVFTVSTMHRAMHLWYGPLGASRGIYIQVQIKACAEIVRKSCNLSGVAVQSPQPPDGKCTEPVWLPCRVLRGDGAAIVAPPCSFWACGLRAVPVRGLCLMPPTTCLRATDLRFFKFVLISNAKQNR